MEFILMITPNLFVFIFAGIYTSEKESTLKSLIEKYNDTYIAIIVVINIGYFLSKFILSFSKY